MRTNIFIFFLISLSYESFAWARCAKGQACAAEEFFKKPETGEILLMELKQQYEHKKKFANIVHSALGDISLEGNSKQLKNAARKNKNRILGQSKVQKKNEDNQTKQQHKEKTKKQKSHKKSRNQ